MNVRTLSALVAFAAFTPLAASATATSGDFTVAEVIGPQAAVRSTPDFPRSEYRDYIEGNFSEVFARKQTPTLTREEVRGQITAAPLPVIGA
jgi:hypothetical protein